MKTENSAMYFEILNEGGEIGNQRQMSDSKNVKWNICLLIFFLFFSIINAISS